MSDTNEIRLSMANITHSRENTIGESDSGNLIECNPSYQQIITNEKQSNFSESNKRYFGKHKPFFFIGRDPFFTIGPDCISFIYLLINYELGQYFLCMWSSLFTIGILVYIYASSHLTLIVKTITELILIFQVLTYLLTALRNPGIASIVIDEYEENKLINNPR